MDYSITSLNSRAKKKRQFHERHKCGTLLRNKGNQRDMPKGGTKNLNMDIILAILNQ